MQIQYFYTVLIISFVITIAVRSPAVMTTSRIPHEYHTSDEFTYRNNNTRILPHAVSNNTNVITTKRRNGSYNVVEKDFGDHKVVYHIPIEYGDDYDISQLEDIPYIEEQEQATNSPRLVRRKIYQEYNDNDDYEYVEEIPVERPRRRIYVSPRRERDPQVVKRIYESRSPTRTVEYIYEDDHPDLYEYRPRNEEEVEYVVRERVPKQIYMEEPQPVRRTVYVEDPSIPFSAPQSPPPPPPPPPPASYSPRRSPYQPSPRPIVNQKSPSWTPTKPIRYNNISPSSPTRKQPTVRSPPIYESLVKPNIPKTTEPPLRLMDIVAQNRAKRGSRIPKPRREVDEENVYDPPTYKRNVIKNGFIVHK